MKLRKHFDNSHSRGASTLIATALLLVASGAGAFASSGQEKVIYTFQGGSDGSNPYAGLIADKDGNLYGTTTYGGSSTCLSGCGTVFELSPPATTGGAWTETQLYIFQGGSDGANPMGPLTFDKAGNLYGTTNAGDGINTDGTVFELSPAPGGSWTQTVLYGFPVDGTHGLYPTGSLAFDPNGNLYGTTRAGGTQCCSEGTAFQLSPPATPGGSWTETLIHSFGDFGSDALYPWSGAIFHGGALYGTAPTGGFGGYGIIFQFTYLHGQWTYHLFYSFGSEIGEPLGGVTFDKNGNIYGTAFGTGRQGCDYNAPCGGVFEVSPPATTGGAWTEKTLYYFAPGKDGSNPRGSLLVDSNGNVFGTASAGGLVSKGSHTGNGAVFELTPASTPKGKWTETTVHDFSGSAFGDGSGPESNLIGVKNKLYGTTYEGGSAGYGTVFSITIEP